MRFTLDFHPLVRIDQVNGTDLAETQFLPFQFFVCFVSLCKGLNLKTAVEPRMNANEREYLGFAQKLIWILPWVKSVVPLRKDSVLDQGELTHLFC